MTLLAYIISALLVSAIVVLAVGGLLLMAGKLEEVDIDELTRDWEDL